MVEQTGLHKQSTFLPDRISKPPLAEYKFGRESKSIYICIFTRPSLSIINFQLKSNNKKLTPNRRIRGVTL